ncbi:AAA family ATPase [Cohaesibacter intestini]|uniref:AAA family ATPase n=1 Tax=Cohaesibacter intestini TaxID=2211145 RepID=UPI000DEB19C8|nr:AAA family ATPase [Cohaesibacter intestini]
MTDNNFKVLSDMKSQSNVTTLPKRKSFKRTNTNDIMATEYAPIRWIVPEYLPEGFNVLAGRQKLGKTWLAIDWAVSVATGQHAMGQIPCEQGDVLYIDMENGARRVQRRIKTLFPDEKSVPDLSRLDWVEEAVQLDQGFIECLESWRLSVSEPRLVVIDVLQRIKPAGTSNRNAYENDYVAFAELQRWATQNGVAVLALHHTRKGGADDPLEALTGSNGLSAVADATLLLDRDGNGITLYVRGRDVEEKETALTFAGGIWSMHGEATEVRRSSERAAILDELLTADEWLTPTDIAIITGRNKNPVTKMLSLMSKSGEVMKAKKGHYYHPSRTDLTPGNVGNKVRSENKGINNNDLEESDILTLSMDAGKVGKDQENQGKEGRP